jgi:hypothetical protein
LRFVTGNLKLNHADTGWTQRSANLARIRDNQRRSRARRKEYLQDLEVRFRNCEQLGVEASAEIQAAARRVVDENKRLRLLLKQRGLSDADIDNAPIDSDAAGASLTASARSLESLLSVKRICSPGGCAPSQGASSPNVASPTTSVTTVSETDFNTSPRPAPTSNPHTDPNPAPNARDYLQSAYLTKSASHAPSFSQDTLFPPQPAYNFNNIPTSMYNNNINSLDTSFQAGATSWEPCNFSTTQTLPSPDSDTQGCRTAVGILRSIDQRAGDEVERQLGCNYGQECQVPTQHVFDILSRIPGLGAV